MKDNKYVEIIKFLDSLLNYRYYNNRPLYVVDNWLTAVGPQEGEAGGTWELQKCLNPDDSILGVTYEYTC